MIGRLVIFVCHQKSSIFTVEVVMAIDPKTISMRQDLFGGVGRVAVATILRDSGPFVVTLWCALDAGASVGPHRQAKHPEQIICVAGNGEIVIDGRRNPFSTGDAYHVPFGAVLALTNPSQAPLEYLIIKAKNGISV